MTGPTSCPRRSRGPRRGPRTAPARIAATARRSRARRDPPGAPLQRRRARGPARDGGRPAGTPCVRRATGRSRRQGRGRAARSSAPDRRRTQRGRRRRAGARCGRGRVRRARPPDASSPARPPCRPIRRRGRPGRGRAPRPARRRRGRGPRARFRHVSSCASEASSRRTLNAEGPPEGGPSFVMRVKRGTSAAARGRSGGSGWPVRARDAGLLEDLELGEVDHLRGHVHVLDAAVGAGQVLLVVAEVVQRVLQPVLDGAEG